MIQIIYFFTIADDLDRIPPHISTIDFGGCGTVFTVSHTMILMCYRFLRVVSVHPPSYGQNRKNECASVLHRATLMLSGIYNDDDKKYKIDDVSSPFSYCVRGNGIRTPTNEIKRIHIIVTVRQKKIKVMYVYE